MIDAFLHIKYLYMYNMYVLKEADIFVQYCHSLHNVTFSMQDGYCLFNQSRCGASISKFYNTPTGNMSALVMAIYEKGPIAVAIDASHRSFSFYANGVYYEKECGKYNI